jgi:hypothetical protein
MHIPVRIICLRKKALSHLAKNKVSAQILHGEDDGFVSIAAVSVDVALLNAVHLLQRYHKAAKHIIYTKFNEKKGLFYFQNPDLPNLESFTIFVN